MLNGSTIILVSLLYIGVLFAIAYVGDKRADAGRSLISNPYVYALSMAVYCTAWTFYGSVGRAARGGTDFLPIYIGPTLMAALWWFVLRKIIRISKQNRITSIADFIASRYGKSIALGGFVTVIAVIGIVPYIALQLKAVATSFTLLWTHADVTAASQSAVTTTAADTAFYVALVLAAFAILFGTRHLDVTEHHEGLVAAIAFESVIKLLAFLAVGLFVTFGVYNGFGDLFQKAAVDPALRQLFMMGDATNSYSGWAALLLLSMMAIMFLPRQFQVAVVENVDERHLNKAIWLFPLYLLIINIFVLPIAFGGLLHFPDGKVDADTFVLTVPMAEGQEALALLVFLGGFSAATGMVIVETVALSTMVSNDLVMPLVLGLRMLPLNERGDLGGMILAIRRIAIAVILLLGYLYFRLTAQSSPLVSIGLVSFAAVAQFAPAILGGIYWKGATRLGALSGLIGGFLVWGYTLPLPSLAESGWLPTDFIEVGLFGSSLLRPYQLLGIEQLDPVAHSLVWSMLVNVGLFTIVSLVGRQSVLEHSQASLFVDSFNYAANQGTLALWRGTATVQALRELLSRFLGERRADTALAAYARQRGLDWDKTINADAELVQHAERLLAGAMGAASARVAIASVVKEEALTLDEVMRMLDETSQVIAYSRQLEQRSQQLEQKSLELEAATAELRAANERLQELDRLKDDFISTVTHELRTPLTSIRAFSEILYDNPDLPAARRSHFLEIILKESERLTRLINQVLDLAKLEAGAAEWNTDAVDLRHLIQDALASTEQLINDKEIRVEIRLPEEVPLVVVDRDRITQVLLNLLSNAIKFCQAGSGVILLTLQATGDALQVSVQDNGPGISPQEQQRIFDKFRQVHDHTNGKPQGTGLGLPISKQIIAHYGGDLWVDSAPGHGATFHFTLPLDSVG
ncbi:MAG: histidine kinase [Caldilinea sp. CFX5]|nr:histidine kinase [Caldilinea sp. CFX5]